jgi:hypothetical protein
MAVPGRWARPSRRGLESLKKRVNAIPFTAAHKVNGAPFARIHSMIESLEGIATAMKAEKDQPVEGDDYHWSIVGDLVGIVGALLDKLEV